jgi:hypothetical protein
MSKRFAPNRSRPLAVAAAASILLATYVIGKEDKAQEVELSIPVRANDAQRVASTGADASRALPELDLEKLNRVKVDETAVNLFTPKNWVAPPPMPAVAPAPVTPPPPSAPPLPFIYVGKLMDGDKLVIFLSRQDTKYSVSAGDVIDNSYRVDQVSESGVVFTYLPLNIRQTLTINPPQ